jgi:hypothetical protein
MNEKPIERLNYYNGQRLEADDLKLEQEYHIRVRRWLNRSLYSAGIARGLEVKAEKEGLNVVVRPGLALDSEGREIILLEEERIAAIGKHNLVGNVDVGFYLTIQYREQKVAEEPGGYTPKNGRRKKAADCLAWGGPSRVLAEPILWWSDMLPHESSGKIVLARVLLDDKCKNIESVQTDVRRYVGASSASKVRQYALEGERHIDSNNPGRIYFHIRGRQPSAVTLYLRAEEFSTLYYTEMGKHSHSATVSGGTEDADPELLATDTRHQHYVSLTASADTETTQTAKHTHMLTAREGYLGESGFPGAPGADNKGKDLGRAGFFLIERDWKVTVPSTDPTKVNYTPVTDNKNDYNILGEVDGKIDGGGQHSHPVTGYTEFHPGFSYKHTHKISGSGGTGDAGVTDPSPPAYTAHSGDPLTFVTNLQIYIGKVEADGKRPALSEDKNYTKRIMAQLQNAQSAIYGGKNILGEGIGGENDPLANNGTGAIKLDFLQGLDFDEGEYYIILHAPDKDPETEDPIPHNGGRILYNLYVE